MKRFESWDGIEIAYHEWGEESAAPAPVVLHHGFVADAQSNWVATGVIDAQAQAVYRGRIALDRIHAPTLILAGDEDPMAVRPEILAEAIPNAVLQTLSGNHIQTLSDPRFTQSIIEFLA